MWQCGLNVITMQSPACVCLRVPAGARGRSDGGPPEPQSVYRACFNWAVGMVLIRMKIHI